MVRRIWCGGNHVLPFDEDNATNFDSSDMKQVRAGARLLLWIEQAGKGAAPFPS